MKKYIASMMAIKLLHNSEQIISHGALLVDANNIEEAYGQVYLHWFNEKPLEENWKYHDIDVKLIDK